MNINEKIAKIREIATKALEGNDILNSNDMLKHIKIQHEVRLLVDEMEKVGNTLYFK